MTISGKKTISITDIIENAGHCIECKKLLNDNLTFLIKYVSRLIDNTSPDITDEFKKETTKLIIRKSICDICYRDIKIKHILE